MKLLKDVTLYCIKVDYFMWNEEKQEEYTEPVYLCIDTETKKKNGEPMNLIIFEEDINNPCLRVFDTENKAKKYMKDHEMNNSICYDNNRVVKITYDFENKTWREYAL